MTTIPLDDEVLDLIAACVEPGGPDLLRTLAIVDGDLHWPAPGGPERARVADRGRTFASRDDVIAALVEELREARRAAAPEGRCGQC